MAAASSLMQCAFDGRAYVIPSSCVAFVHIALVARVSSGVRMTFVVPSLLSGVVARPGWRHRSVCKQSVEATNLLGMKCRRRGDGLLDEFPNAVVRDQADGCPHARAP